MISVTVSYILLAFFYIIIIGATIEWLTEEKPRATTSKPVTPPSKPLQYKSINPPAFHHDCMTCKFVGHFLDYDVYVCKNSIVARYGTVGDKYFSQNIKSFLTSISNPNLEIGFDDKYMKFQEYLFSEHMLSYEKAMLIGLLCYYSGTVPPSTYIYEGEDPWESYKSTNINKLRQNLLKLWS